MRQLIFLLFLIPFINADLAAQKPPETVSEYEKAYQRRIRREMISGVYIPKDIGNAFAELNRLTDKESRAKFKSMPEALAAQKLHFSLGRWLIVNWGFYEGSRFTVWLNQVGLFHPDDMARFVIITYHRNLNRNSLEVKALVEHLLENRKKIEAEKKQKSPKTILSEETRKRQ
ncbi:MAG: DUF6794 domain-containing protein [Saprospiraceae bacterium]